MRIVIARSYDMDSCILLPGLKLNYTLWLHKQHFDDIAKEKPIKQYVFSGSTRQTPRHDAAVAQLRKTPLGSDTVREIAKHLGAVHNTFFAGDVATYTVKEVAPRLTLMEPGWLLKKANDNHFIDSGDCRYAFVDYNKIFLIYLQVSNICVHEPDADKIVFNFYDDYDDFILKPIKEFFEMHSQLIYKKVEINLWHYYPDSGMSEPSHYATIQGTCDKPHVAYYDVLTSLARNERLTYQYVPEASSHAFVVDTDRFSKAFVDTLVHIGTTNAPSHKPGEGLVDYGNASAVNTVTMFRDGDPSNASSATQKTFSTNMPAAYRP